MLTIHWLPMFVAKANFFLLPSNVKTSTYKYANLYMVCVYNNICGTSEQCNLASVASIFCWFYFFSKGPFTIQNSHVIGFMISVSRPTTLTSARSLSLLKQFIYMYLQGLVTHFQKVVLFIMSAYCFGDIRVCSRRKLLNFRWVSIFFDILIANISWTVAQAAMNHTIFWKSVMRPFRCIYVNCFNRLRFLAEVSLTI